MDEDKACKFFIILVPSAILLCIIGLILYTQYYPLFAGVALIILVICYIIGKRSFPEWSKNPKVRGQEINGRID